MKSIAIVDVQGFKTDNNEFILKEIAIVSDNKVLVLMIEPPYPLHNLSVTERRQVRWIEKHRNIYWNDGFVPYKNWMRHVDDFLLSKTIYCKGSEKVNWLKEMFDYNDVINLEDISCPSLPILNEDYKLSNDINYCIYHSNICALKNVSCLKKWCKQQNKID